jgi:DNA-binding NarL/FixJ family response regulator
MHRVVVVDDHRLVREGLRLLLQQDGDTEVVGEAARADDAVDLVVAERPDVALVDIGLSDDDGVSLIGLIRSRVPATRVLVLSMFSDGETVRQALLAGASGYLVKGASAQQLLTAIDAVARGERYLHPSVAGVVVDDGLRWLRSAGGLSPREREVMRLLGSGRNAIAIATALGISIHTVRRHLANAAQKLDLHGTQALRAYAVRHGLGAPGASGRQRA